MVCFSLRIEVFKVRKTSLQFDYLKVLFGSQSSILEFLELLLAQLRFQNSLQMSFKLKNLTLTRLVDRFQLNH